MSNKIHIYTHTDTRTARIAMFLWPIRGIRARVSFLCFVFSFDAMGSTNILPVATDRGGKERVRVGESRRMVRKNTHTQFPVVSILMLM